MKIKSAKQPSFLQSILLLAGLLVLLFLSGFLSKNKKDHRPVSKATATAFLEKESTLKEVLDHYKDHLVFFSVQDDASLKFPKKLREDLAAIGGDTLAKIGLRHSYAGVYQGGKIIVEAKADSAAVTLRFGNARVESAGNSAGNFSRLSLGTTLYTADRRGLNLFVVTKLGQLVGMWNFDFYDSESPLSTASKWGGGGVEKLRLTITEKQFYKLKKKRDEAVKAEILLSEDGDFVPGKLFFQDKNHKVKLRLKGDWTDHLQGDQWSFRIVMDTDETLLGMRKFSIHRPSTRNYAGEWLYHQVLADAGILNLQYHFVEVELTVLGDLFSEVKNLGIYALEESFDKQLIERNQRREGVILKLDESLMWEEHVAYLEGDLNTADLLYLDFHKYQEMNVVPFAEKRIREDSVLYKQYLTGSALFRDYIDGKKKLSEAFDVKLTAKFQALSNLLGANHAMAGHNYRVYYNPVTSKLEPIGFDGNAGKKVWGFMDFFNSKDDLVFLEAYVKAVEEVTSDGYMEKIKYWPGLSNNIALMQRVNNKYEWTDKMLEHNRQMLRGRIHPQQSLRINFNGVERGQLMASIENFSRFPVDVFDLSYNGKKVFGKTVERTILMPKTRTLVAFKLDIDYEKLFTKKGNKKVGFNPQTDIDKIKVTYKTLGSSELNQERMLLWRADRDGVLGKDPFQRGPNAHEFDFLVFDEKVKTITCRPGHWNVEAPITIPPGYTFIAGPGCHLNLMSQFTTIFSYSPVRFIGTPDNPVDIFSGTEMGHGILVLNTQDTSVLRHCKFRGLSNPSTPGWSITGAVNFYEADVILEHCSFSENRCEDALNILRSHFQMTNCTFTDIHADAFDGDFVTGKIKSCIFTHLGNDAIDVSGSHIQIENTAIDHAGDKGISAGENSKIDASHLVIKNCEIALASKDQSIFNITHALLDNNKLCFTAFKKKPEFGPANITADSVDLNNCQLEYLIEAGSSLLLNGKKVETVTEVKNKMYGVEFGKSSK